MRNIALVLQRQIYGTLSHQEVAYVQHHDDLNDPVEDAYRRIAPCFARSETRARSRRYLAGLLSRTERKNGWQLAEQGGERHPRGVQRLLDEAEWDAEEVRDELRRYVVDHLGQPSGILIVDETGFLKKGTKSAGVAASTAARPVAGRINRSASFWPMPARPGVPSSTGSSTFPRSGSTSRLGARRRAFPQRRTFATKPQLAQQMLERAFAAAVPAQWVVGDCIYGSEDLRHWLEAQGQAYVFAVPSTHAIWEQGEQIGAADLVARHPELGWVRWSAGEGSQGPRRYDWAWMRLPYTSCSRDGALAADPPVTQSAGGVCLLSGLWSRDHLLAGADCGGRTTLAD